MISNEDQSVPASGEANGIASEVVTPPSTSQAAPAEKQDSASDNGLVVTKQEKTVAALGYIYFLCVLPLAFKRDSAYCQFHGKQALVLAILFFILSWLGVFSGFLGGLFYIIQLIVTIIAFIQANWRRIQSGDEICSGKFRPKVIDSGS